MKRQQCYHYNVKQFFATIQLVIVIDTKYFDLKKKIDRILIMKNLLCVFSFLFVFTLFHPLSKSIFNMFYIINQVYRSFK